MKKIIFTICLILVFAGLLIPSIALAKESHILVFVPQNTGQPSADASHNAYFETQERLRNEYKALGKDFDTPENRGKISQEAGKAAKAAGDAARAQEARDGASPVDIPASSGSPAAVTGDQSATPAAPSSTDTKVKLPVIPCGAGAAPCISEDVQRQGGKGIRDYVANVIGGNVISGFLGTIAIVAVIFIIVGGVQMILAFGNEEAVGKAKKTLIWAFVGLAIAILSVAMVNIISNLDFK